MNRVTVARNLRRNATPAEQVLWRELRQRLPVSGTHWRRQVALGGFVVNFCCHPARLVVEVDGATNSTDAELRNDAARTTWLASRGYRVLRFTNAEVFETPAAVLDTIHAAVVASGSRVSE